MRVFVIVALVLYLGITLLLGWALMKTLKAFHVWRWPIVYWSVFGVIALSMFLSRIIESTVFTVIGNYWMFFLEYGLIITLVSIIFYWVTPWKNIKVIGGVAISILLFCLGLGLYNAYTPIERELMVEINKEAEDLKVVVASDFHLGVLSTKRHLERFVEMTNEIKPDLVLLVGDIIDDDPKWFIEANMGEVLSKIESKYGVYGVLGNHEYYGDKIDEFAAEMNKANVTILLDETILINDQFYLTGQEDASNKSRKALADLVPEIEDKPWIVMNHTPVELEVPTDLNVDFHVSGHTHRGQLWPNNFITSRIYEVDYGHLVKNNSQFLVSSGFGFWGPPMRIGSQSEVWVVDLKFSK